MSFGMISYVREKQHERKDCFIPAWVPKASGGGGQIVTQRDRAARLKEFQLLDGRSHATLVNTEEGFCGLQGSSPIPSNDFLLKPAATIVEVTAGFRRRILAHLCSSRCGLLSMKER
jgi:hypothetical protein